MADIVDLAVCRREVCDLNQNIVYMYSGQGSQYYGMARTLFEGNSIFRDCMENFDRIVKGISGRTVIQELYFSGRTMSQSFDRLILTHPAIFMVEYSLTQMLYGEGIRPTEIIGSSLGLYTCLSVAEVIQPEEMLEFIVRQAMVIEEYCELGGMIAVLADYGLFSNIPIMYNNTELVSISHDNHFVISGEINGINMVEGFLTENKITFFRLPVSYGFHSKTLDSVYDKFIQLAKRLNYAPPKLKIYSNKDAKSIKEIKAEFLWEIVRGSIEFPRLLKNFDNEQYNIFIDVGPAGTLANIAKGILKKDKHLFGILSQFNTEKRNIDRIKNFLENRLCS